MDPSVLFDQENTASRMPITSGSTSVLPLINSKASSLAFSVNASKSSVCRLYRTWVKINSLQRHWSNTDIAQEIVNTVKRNFP